VKQTSEFAGGIRHPTVIAGVVLLLLLLGGTAAFHLGHDDLASILPVGLSAEEFADTIRSWGAWAMVGSVLLMVAHSFVPLPSEFIAIANGMVFGVVIGTIITWIGAMLGAVLAFALARWLGRWFVQAILPSRYTAAIDEWTQEQGTPILLISRLLPVVSFNLINYAAGLTSVSWWTFLWTTGLGITPLTFLMVFAGEQMMSGKWELALILIPACIAISLLAYVIARKRKT
jgi:uncharacterized membrane protein YdjX (TVP38/TMEM64 family)